MTKESPDARKPMAKSTPSKTGAVTLENYERRLKAACNIAVKRLKDQQAVLESIRKLNREPSEEYMRSVELHSELTADILSLSEASHKPTSKDVATLAGLIEKLVWDDGFKR